MEFKIKLSNQKDKVVADESIIESLKNYLSPEKVEFCAPKGKKPTKSMKSKVYNTIECKHCFSDNKIEINDKKPVCSTCGNELDRV